MLIPGNIPNIYNHRKEYILGDNVRTELFGKELDITLKTTAGLRPENQDTGGYVVRGRNGTVSAVNEKTRNVSAEPTDDFILALVCDGMGGMNDGAAASLLLTEELVKWGENADGTYDELLASFKQAVIDAEKEMMDTLPGAGTTLSAVLGIGDRWISAHLGDSRCYAVCPDDIWRTADQSPVEKLFREGRITEDQMNDYPGSNLMDRCVGGPGFAATLEINDIPENWSILALCSDGAFGYMPPKEFKDELRQCPDADSLVDVALKKGSTDNTTVLRIGRART